MDEPSDLVEPLKDTTAERLAAVTTSLLSWRE